MNSLEKFIDGKFIFHQRNYYFLKKIYTFVLIKKFQNNFEIFLSKQTSLIFLHYKLIFK